MDTPLLNTSPATDDREHRLQLARLLVQRLERLSADSSWARRASGVRGALLRALEQAERGPGLDERDWQRLQADLDWWFYALKKAAQEY